MNRDLALWPLSEQLAAALQVYDYAAKPIINGVFETGCTGTVYLLTSCR